MPLPAEHANFLLHLMGIQTWSSRGDACYQAKRLQLESDIQHCRSCELAPQAQGRVLGVGRFSASVLVVVDCFEQSNACFSSAVEQRLFDNVLKGVAIPPEAVLMTPLIRCVHEKRTHDLYDAQATACLPHLARLIHCVKPVCILVMGERSAHYFKTTLHPHPENASLDWEGIPLFILPSLERLCTHPLEKKQVYLLLQSVSAILSL